MKHLIITIAASLLVVGQTFSQTSQSVNMNNMKDAQQKGGYTFKLSDKVARQKVRT